VNNTELILQVREDLQQLRQTGSTSLDLELFDKYLSQMAQALEKEPGTLDPVAIERIRSAREFAIANVKRAGDSELEMFRSVISAGQSALRAAMVINGAAATAILAFIGQLLAKGSGQLALAPYALPLGTFVAGVGVGALAFGVNYVGQWLYAHNHDKTGHAANLLTIGLATSSYAAFAIAGWLLYLLFRAL
jgi:hypothetical protein